MPMTNSGMSAAIKAAIQGQYGAPADPAELQKFCDALGQAIVGYIQANAQVPAGIAVEVSTGTGIGATTAPGTVT